MLNWQRVLEYIKENLSMPFQTLEKSDEEIIDFCKRNALREFEEYFPQNWRMTLDCSDPALKVPDRASEFYMIDPDDREIKDVIQFIPELGDSIILGHPYMGAWSFGELENWSLQTYKANLLKQFSNFNYTHEFIPPNMIRISPLYSGKCVLVYNRSHDLELSSIHPGLHSLFIDLCYGKFGMMIGRIRQKYNTFQTPFGEVQVNGEQIYQDAKEVYDKTVESMKNGSMPNVIFESG